MGRKPPKHSPIQSTSTLNDRTWSKPSVMIAIAIALFVLTRSYILFVFHPQVSDLNFYWDYAARVVDLHHTPYQPDFVVPYPPVALWTICVPRFIDNRLITRPQDASQLLPLFLGYQQTFRGLMFLCDLTSFIIILLIVRKLRPEMAGWAALLYTILTAILANLLYDRLDMGLLMLLMLGVYCWTRSLGESGWTITWATAAYALLGLGISYKIIPLICVPFLLLSDFHAPRRVARLTSAMVVLAAGISMPFLIQYAISGPGVFDIFKFHAEREIQIESLYSTLMMIASPFGVPAFVIHSHGAQNLTGSLSYAMKLLSTILLFGFLAGFGTWSLFRWARYSRRDAYRLTCFIIPAAVILSNVLSPQYFIWAFPLLLLAVVEILPAEGVLPWTIGALLIAVAAMTTWVFPYHYFSTELNPHGLVPMNLTDPIPSSTVNAVLGLRNFTYLGIVLWLGMMLIKHIKQMSNSSKLARSNIK